MNGTRKQDIEFKLLSKLQSIASNSLQHIAMKIRPDLPIAHALEKK